MRAAAITKQPVRDRGGRCQRSVQFTSSVNDETDDSSSFSDGRNAFGRGNVGHQEFRAFEEYFRSDVATETPNARRTRKTRPRRCVNIIKNEVTGLNATAPAGNCSDGHSPRACAAFYRMCGFHTHGRVRSAHTSRGSRGLNPAKTTAPCVPSLIAFTEMTNCDGEREGDR